MEQPEPPSRKAKKTAVPCSMRTGDSALVRKPGIYIYIDGTMEQNYHRSRTPVVRGLGASGLFHRCSIIMEQWNGSEGVPDANPVPPTK